MFIPILEALLAVEISNILGIRSTTRIDITSAELFGESLINWAVYYETILFYSIIDFTACTLRRGKKKRGT